MILQRMGGSRCKPFEGSFAIKGNRNRVETRDACENKNGCVCVSLKVDDVTTWFCKLVGRTW